jgi:hypothetical protein
MRSPKDGTKVGSFDLVDNPRRVASYLTKEFRDPVVANSWPRYFRLVATTRNWCPEWMTKTEWQAKHKADTATKNRRLNRFRSGPTSHAPHRFVDTTTGEISS